MKFGEKNRYERFVGEGMKSQNDRFSDIVK